MELVYQIATVNNLEEILEFANTRLAEQVPDETERMFASWHAAWRKEALEHYLGLGWSFVAREKNDPKLAGFFLGQAFLFMRGQTQTLWIEHLDGKSDEVRAGLSDVAVRLSREKHLQRVLFGESSNVRDTLSQVKHQNIPEAIIEVFTTKG